MSRANDELFEAPYLGHWLGPLRRRYWCRVIGVGVVNTWAGSYGRSRFTWAHMAQTAPDKNVRYLLSNLFHPGLHLSRAQLCLASPSCPSLAFLAKTREPAAPNTHLPVPLLNLAHASASPEWLRLAAPRRSCPPSGCSGLSSGRRRSPSPW
jgi:hypothetical protein